MGWAGRKMCVNCRSESSVIMAVVPLTLAAHVSILKLFTEVNLAKAQLILSILFSVDLEPVAGPRSPFFFVTFFILYTVGRILWPGDQSNAKAPTYIQQDKHRINEHNHFSSGIRTHDFSV
jgi:hypothetical protein